MSGFDVSQSLSGLLCFNYYLKFTKTLDNVEDSTPILDSVYMILLSWDKMRGEIILMY